MNKKLQAIAHNAAADLEHFVQESEKEILNAWAAAEKEAQLQDSKPKLKLGFSISLDLDKDTMETALSFGVKHTISKTAEIPDPDQLPLPMGGSPEPTVEIKTGGKSTGPVPLKKFAAAVKIIKERADREMETPTGGKFTTGKN